MRNWRTKLAVLAAVACVAGAATQAEAQTLSRALLNKNALATQRSATRSSRLFWNEQQVATSARVLVNSSNLPIVDAWTGSLVFEGATSDAHETTFAIADPTADRTITFPDATGTVMLTSVLTTAGAGIEFEGATANDFELSLSIADPTADRTVTVPDASGAVMLSSLATNAADAANAVTGGTNQLIFEGATANGHEVVITPTDPTGDRTITLPDESGTVLLSTSIATAGSGIVFEGATSDDFELTLAVEDPGADVTVTIPAGTGTLMLSSLGTNGIDVVNSVWGGTNALVFEGATADAHATSLTVTDPTGTRTVTLPDASGVVMLTAAVPEAATAVSSAANAIVFEGATADAHATSLTIADPTGTRTVTLADASGTVMLSSLATNAAGAANAVTGGTNQLIFEGATADAHELVLTPTDPTGTRTVTFADASGTPVLASGIPEAAKALWGADNGFVFEGATANDHETTFAVTDPTGDRTITFPDGTGTVMLSTMSAEAGASIAFEGSTADDFELTLAVTDPTSDTTVTLADASGTVMLSTLATNAPDAANAVTGGTNQLIFEGATADAHETVLQPLDPTGDNTVTLPNDSGAIVFAPGGTTAVGGGTLAIPITHSHASKTTGGVEALTLADGENGQLLTITLAVDGGDGTLTPDHKTGYTNVVFDAAGDTVTLLYVDDVVGWVIVGQSNMTVTP